MLSAGNPGDESLMSFAHPPYRSNVTGQGTFGVWCWSTTPSPWTMSSIHSMSGLFLQESPDQDAPKQVLPACLRHLQNLFFNNQEKRYIHLHRASCFI